MIIEHKEWAARDCGSFFLNMGATFIIHNKISDMQGAPLVVKNQSFIVRVNP